MTRRRRARGRDGRVVEPLAQARPEQLHHTRHRPDLLAAGEAGQRAGVVQPEQLDVDPRPREALADEWVGEHAARRAGVDQLTHRDFEEHLLLPHERAAALVAERRVRHAPALVLGTDQVLDRDLDIIEEDLVELTLARDLSQWANVDALRRHRDRQHRDALVVRRARVGPHERDGPVRDEGVRRPHLLPVDDIRVAAVLRARREAGQIAPRVGLAEELAPDVVAREDARNPPLTLFLRAVRHQRRSDEADATPRKQRWRARARQFLVVDRGLCGRRPASPYSTGQWTAIQFPAGACGAIPAMSRLRHRSSACRQRAADVRSTTRATRRGTARRPPRARRGAPRVGGPPPSRRASG